jgi:hypothetical protein
MLSMIYTTPYRSSSKTTLWRNRFEDEVPQERICYILATIGKAIPMKRIKAFVMKKRKNERKHSIPVRPEAKRIL